MKHAFKKECVNSQTVSWDRGNDLHLDFDMVNQKYT